MDSLDRFCGIGGTFDLVARVRLEHRAQQIQEGQHVLRQQGANGRAGWGEGMRMRQPCIDGDAQSFMEYERLLDLFPRLRERLAQGAGTLSGGEQQMVAMARALLGRPQMICMDEPTIGLSPVYVDRTLELIQAIKRQGVTIFMVEQNTHLALQIADYGYVLQTGQISLSGSARELLHNPAIRSAYLGSDRAM